MKVAIIGAGASGLLAAYAAASNGNEVTVFEKNEKCGKKIYITGKGRCNVTNDVPPRDFLPNIVTNPKFMTSAIYSFPPERLKSLLQEGGLKLKTERGNRVFPQSDKASDVTKCLVNLCENAGVTFKFDSEVQNLDVLESTMRGIIVKNNFIQFDKVIVCTGGMSYPATGSTGDGYKFAEKFGHKIVEPKPALCGLELKGNYFCGLQGLTLKNVELVALYGGKRLFLQRGELLFTHFGISGPLVLSLSSLVNRLPLSELELYIDLKPALDDRQLDERILRDFSQNPNKSIGNCLKNLLPNAIIGEVLSRSGIDAAKKVNSVSKAERKVLLTNIKKFGMIIKSLRGFDEAVVTSGGVDVSEVDPKTMESKLIKGLYFCGEVLDVDAFTGGFNLQIAFSTGFAAGNSIKRG